MRKFVRNVAACMSLSLALTLGACSSNESKDKTTKTTKEGTTEVASKKEETKTTEKSSATTQTEAPTEKPTEKIEITDLNSKVRPYAVMINNTPVAVKVQTGLNNAVCVYEIPTEGYTSRLLAVFRGVDSDMEIGTIRSARHNFFDYCYEWDAVLIQYGWSHYAEAEERAGALDFINAILDPGAFYRNNPYGLDYEHTAYTSLNNIRSMAESKGYAKETDKGVPFNYVKDVDLSGREGAVALNSVTIPYCGDYQYTTFVYDPSKKIYLKNENGSPCVDDKTKEQFNTKNIIVQMVNHSVTDDGYYWNIDTVGEGSGYYIVNGYAVKITWSKAARDAKTIYRYENGEEIKLADGRTYVQLCLNEYTPDMR